MSDLFPDQCAHCLPTPDWVPPPLGSGPVYRPPGPPLVYRSSLGIALSACRCQWCNRTIRFGESFYTDARTDVPVCVDCAGAEWSHAG